MAESKELKSLLMRRGDAKTGLKLNIQKTIHKIYSTFMASVLSTWRPSEDVSAESAGVRV